MRHGRQSIINFADFEFPFLSGELKACIASHRWQHALMNFTKNIGMLLLAVYLIVVGIIGLTGIGPGVLLPILALIAGVFILLGK